MVKEAAQLKFKAFISLAWGVNKTDVSMDTVQERWCLFLVVFVVWFKWVVSAYVSPQFDSKNRQNF